MTSGCYKFEFPSGSAYIGSSNNCRRRFCEHLSLLRRGVHPNARLQSAFAKYGEPGMSYEVLVEVGPQGLIAAEQALIDRLKPCLNISGEAGRPGLQSVLKNKLTRSNASWKEKMAPVYRRVSTGRGRRVECDNGICYLTLAAAAEAASTTAARIASLASQQSRHGPSGLRFKLPEAEWGPEISARERRLRTRVANGKLKHTEEAKAAMRSAKAGAKVSEAALLAACEASRRPVVGIDVKTGAETLFPSIRAAGEHFGKTGRQAGHSITRVLSGVRSSAFGHYWRRFAA